MKRSIMFLAAAVVFGFGLLSCDRENENGGNNGGGSGGGSTSVNWVDLGLPSGLLWADRNVGADSPEDYGNYYAWGETDPKEVYDWTTYKYGNANNALTKYCNKADWGLNGFTDNLTTLEASDDAATVNIRGKAHMPRDYEWQELMDNTTSTWTTRNGVNGRLLTGANGESLFLPAAGSRYGSSLLGAGEGGIYWSSTLTTDRPYDAWGFGFDSGNQGMYDYSRYYGFSVRAVRAGQN